MVVNQTPANAEDRTELFYAVFLAQGGDKFQGLLASDISKAVVDSICQRNTLSIISLGVLNFSVFLGLLFS
jgi:hypothetical protein